MAIGFFNIEEPGLTYSQRKAYKPGSGLSIDPNNAGAPIAGEWLALQDDQTIDRVDTATVEVVSAFPLLVDKGRTDIQSGGKLTVLAHPGAICQSAAFATLTNADNGITYNVGDELGICRFWDTDGVLRQGLYPIGKGGAFATVNTSETPGAIQAVNGAGGAGESAYAVAKVLRLPYSISGVGVDAGTGFPADPTTPRQVVDIQIL